MTGEQGTRRADPGVLGALELLLAARQAGQPAPDGPPREFALLPYLSVAGVLGVLTAAGAEGLTTSELARKFAFRQSYRGDVQRLLAEANTILESLARRGSAVRGAMEPSAYYHHAPSRRWFITEAGQRYLLAADGRARAAAGARARREARQEKLALRERARADAAARLGAVKPRNLADRDAVIRQLRAEGALTLADIGRAAGLTRERVHQIVKDQEERHR